MDSGDDRDSMAAGGRSDDELPSDFEAMADDDPGSPERPPFHGGSGSTQALSAQEGFLAKHMHQLHALNHLDSGVDLPALLRCLEVARNIYGYMIQHSLSETSDAVFLMYESFFQPLMREALPAALQQLMHDERQAQLLGPQTHKEVQEIRRALYQFIRLVREYLHLALSIHGGRELQPVIHQRAGDDLAHLLRTLATVLEPSHMLYCPAFNCQPPSACPSWRDVLARSATWAAPAVPAAPAAPAEPAAGEAAAAGQPAAAAPADGAMAEGGAAAEGAVEIDLTGEGPVPPPETPSRLVAAAAWRAAMVEVFGFEGGWDMLLQLLSQPERLGDYLWAFLAPLATAAPAMLPEARQKLAGAVAAILQLVRGGLTAVADLSALEGSAPNPEFRVSRMLAYTRAILAAISGPVAAEQEVGPLQREHTLRLLSAPAFTRQLAGLKLLNELVNFTFRSTPQQPECIEALTSWLREHGVVHMVLKSNMHQAQYADQAQRVLSTLLQHGALPEDAIAFLWQLTEDASTFEAVKSNACAILANLGPHMEQAQLQQLFQRLQARAAASGVSEACSILGLLVGMVQRDRKQVLYKGALDCLLSIQLRPDVQPEVAASPAVVELCAALDSTLGISVAQHCIKSLGGDAAVPAAVVLHSLLTQLWRKQDRLTAALKLLNADAALLKACLTHYTIWLERQREAAAAAGLALPVEPGSVQAAREHMTAAGPPAGAFSHKDAVEAWHRLMYRVVTVGNWYLLQDQVERIVQWATVEAVTPFDSTQAWRLAMLLAAGGRKEMMESVADAFLVDCLCRLHPRFVTYPAWRCILAYLCATCEWSEELREDGVIPSNAWVTKTNHRKVRAFLWGVTLDSPDPHLSASASALLAQVHAKQLRSLLAYPTSPRNQPANLEPWIALLTRDTAERLAQLRHTALLPAPVAALQAAAAAEPVAAGEGAAAGGSEAAAGAAGEAAAAGAAAAVPPAEASDDEPAAAAAPPAEWWQPPAVLSRPGAGPGEVEAAAVHCERILKYLATLVEECQGRRMPSPLAHRSSWRGFPLTVTVQLPAQQGQKPIKQDIQQPANLPVGFLRRLLAEWLGKAPQYVRLVAGGRELDSDCATLVQERAGQQPVMVLINQKANGYSGRHVLRAQESAAASQAVGQQPEVYSLALALAQSAAASAPGGTSPASGGSRLAREALHLLSVLPTCPVARQQLRQLLLAPDGGPQLRSLLQRQSGQAAVKPAVLMYAVQCLAGLLYPQQAEVEVAEAAAADEQQGGEAAGAALVAAAAATADTLQRRLLLSGALEVLLELATQQVEPAAAAAPDVDAATHSAVLLLLLHTQEAVQQQQAAAAAAVAAEAAAAAARHRQAAAGGGPEEMSAAAAVAAATAGVAALGDTASMQVDSVSLEPEPAGMEGGSSAAGAAPPEAPAVPAEAAAQQRSRSVSMEAEEAVGAASAGASAAAGEAAAAAEAAVPAQVAAARQELEAAAAALSSLAPAMARYVLRMLCCLLRCHPEQQAADAQQAQLAQQSGTAAVQAAAISQLSSLVAVVELAEQGLQLLKQLAQQSSTAVEIATGAEAPAAEAVVRRLLLHPVSSHLRLLAADWLPSYAAAAPATHRWAFERIVQPLLLAEGAEGPAAGGQEQLALCSHFIETLDYAEFPTARQLLQTLLQRLLAAIEAQGPIDGIAGVVGALIKRLDCREVGVTSGLVAHLLDGCCFPALSTLRTRESFVACWFALTDQAGKATVAAAAAAAESGADSPAAMQAAAAAAQQHQAAATAGSLAMAMWGSCERCILAARLQAASGNGSTSREAAFELLLDLVTHDSGCWQQAAELLQTQVHEAARSLLPQPYNNSPLQLVRAPSAFAGLQNGGATCYMSSVFQQLFMQPIIRQLVLSAPQVAAEEQADSVFHQMQVVFAHLACSVEPWFEPRGFWRAFKDYDGQPVNIREHQDAYEFFTRLQDSIDEHLRSVRRPRAIGAALGGTFAQLITVIEAPQHRSERDEEFYQISLDVRGKRTLAESLDSYVSKELMDGQNQYHSEELGKNVDAEKRVLIKHLPHTLVLHLKRFEFDYETFQRWKVKDRFEFPLQLDMYPYTVEGADEADGRVPASKQPAGHYRYELRGVVVHSGSAFAGHYYSYIKDRSPTGGWFCFDDTSVEPWDPAKLDKDCFGGKFVPEGFTQECDRPNSAYMLFYERAEESAEQLLAAATAAAAAADAAAAAGMQQPAVEAAAEAAAAAAAAPAAAAGTAAEAAAAGAAAAAAATDEDTAMPTPPVSVAAEGQAGAAAAADTAEGKAQPMAVSPAPVPSAQQQGAEPAGATAGEAGGAQPPAAQQGGAQQAQQAGGSGLPYGMPLELYNSVLVSNLRQLGTMQLLSPEYNRFIWSLALHLGEAVAAGTARKAAKREPTSSPGGMDASAASGSLSNTASAAGDCQLAALTSRRGGDLHAVIAEVAMVCLDYILRVALRGNPELRKEVLGSGGKRGRAGLRDHLQDALNKVPAAAAAALTYLASGPGAQAADFLLTMHPSEAVRELVASVGTLAADTVTRQERRTEETVHALKCYVDHLCGSVVPVVLQSVGLIDQLISLLARLGLVKWSWRRAMLDPHLPALLALVRRAIDLWAACDADQRDYNHGPRVLALLGCLLRRFSPDALHGAARRKPSRQPLGDAERTQRNPHILEGCEAVPMPPEVVEWLYGDPAFLRKLLMPGCVAGMAAAKLFSFLMWDNHRHAREWERALLEHILIDATNWRDVLGPELHTLLALTDLGDSLQDDRNLAILLGMEGGPPGILQEMRNNRRSVGCQHLLLALAAHILVEATPNVLMEAADSWNNWPTWAKRFLQLRYRALQEDDTPDSPTIEDLAEATEVGIEEMLDLRNLYQQIQDIESMLKDVLAGAMPVSPSATHSGRSARSSGGGSSTSSEGGGGGGGGQLRGVTVGGRRLHQQTFSGGGAAGGGAAAGQDWQAGLLQYSDGDSPHGAAAPAAAAEEPPAQQHIAAHVPGEQDDEEVIEIHSDGDGDGENRGGGP